MLSRCLNSFKSSKNDWTTVEDKPPIRSYQPVVKLLLQAFANYTGVHVYVRAYILQRRDQTKAIQREKARPFQCTSVTVGC